MCAFLFEWLCLASLQRSYAADLLADQVLGFGLFDVYVGHTLVLLKTIDDNS